MPGPFRHKKPPGACLAVFDGADLRARWRSAATGRVPKGFVPRDTGPYQALWHIKA